ncbi:hypothetical protein [Halobacteriovorax sp. HLS]|uniref:hypothetical protein n=1 Tax=Halobacteriovorax sp. HLS TaxID=2234000 RepID=UPI000FDA8262|nr:hypothetical protein [Halobacteriovorax sp. HLS]
MKRNNWYPVENGKCVIEIKVVSIEQLFDKRDPNPFRIKDLDDDVVEYILSCAHEIGPKKIGKLRIVTNDVLSDSSSSTVETAVREFFTYRADITSKAIHATFNLGFKTLLIGLLFLSSSLFLSSILSKSIDDTYFKTFLKEGLLLVGWVSMWKPINIFLYEWWPLIDSRNYFKVLSDIDIDIEFSNIQNEKKLSELKFG